MEQKKTQDEFFNEFTQNASPDDVKKIDEKLGGMNVGKIAEIWESVLLLYDLVKDPTAAWKSKAAAIGSLIYLISPIDAIPDIIPLFGLTDDVAVIAAAVISLTATLAKYKK